MSELWIGRCDLTDRNRFWCCGFGGLLGEFGPTRTALASVADLAIRGGGVAEVLEDGFLSAGFGACIGDHLIEFLEVCLSAGIERCMIYFEVIEVDIFAAEVDSSTAEWRDVFKVFEFAQFP